MLSVSFREKHLLNKTNRYRFIHKCSFIKKQPCIRDTKRHQNNFLPEKVTEQERDEHLRYVSFDTRNHSLRRNNIGHKLLLVISIISCLKLYSR